jgi:hypothetical protein
VGSVPTERPVGRVLAGGILMGRYQQERRRKKEWEKYQQEDVWSKYETFDVHQELSYHV